MRILLLAVLATAPRLHAAVAVTAEVRPSQVVVGQQFVLSVTVAGDDTNLPVPTVPPLGPISVYNSGSSQSMSWINGKVAASTIYTFMLSARSKGKFVIPAIHAPGAKPSEPIEIEVLDASAATVAADPARRGTEAPSAKVAGSRARRSEIFVTASLDKSKVMVGEQATLTVRFCTSVPLIGNAQYEPPAFSGALTEDLPPVRVGTGGFGGRTYQCSDVKTALFPISAGRLAIGAARVRAQVAGGSMDPFAADFFDRFFTGGGQGRVATVNSDPLLLTVEPLPSPKPDDFSGVIGKLEAQASVDKKQVKAGDAITLTVTVFGAGNVKSIPEPKSPAVPQLRFFDTDSTFVANKDNDLVGGRKVFKTVVVPRVSGRVVIPAFTFIFLDGQTRTYRKASTDPVELMVAPGAPGSTVEVAPTTTPATVTPIDTDIRYLKTAPEASSASRALTEIAEWGPWNAAAVLPLIGGVLLVGFRRAVELDPIGRRARNAQPRAQKIFAEAAALPETEALRAATIIGEALAGFVADKLGLSAAGLTMKSASDGLRLLPHPPSAATLEKFIAAWEEADLRRFAPGAVAVGDVRRFAQEVAAVVETLDKETRG